MEKKEVLAEYTHFFLDCIKSYSETAINILNNIYPFSKETLDGTVEASKISVSLARSCMKEVLENLDELKKLIEIVEEPKK